MAISLQKDRIQRNGMDLTTLKSKSQLAPQFRMVELVGKKVICSTTFGVGELMSFSIGSSLLTWTHNYSV